jgi:ABC-type transport system substrate-binding protein
MSNRYWNPLSMARMRRRRLLGMAAAGGAGITLLAACGGDGNDGEKDASRLLNQRVDTTKQAVPGGTWVRSHLEDQLNFDLNTHGDTGSYHYASFVYDNLVRYGRGTGNKAPGVDQISGDAAESWEMSPDGLQITFKVRPNHTFDSRPPTSGRAMTAADIKWSWDRTAALSPFSGDILNSKNEAGPILSLTTPNDQTVVVKLAFPYAPILEVFAYYSYFWVMPREGEDKIDLRSQARGSGPFLLEKWEPGIGLEYRKNPNWYEKGRPYLDGIKSVILPEYAAALAQFETASLWTFSDGNYRIAPDDILPVKRRHPSLVLLEEPPIGAPEAFYLMFSAKPDSPFRDVRLRRAASMLMDRDIYADTFYNLGQFRDAGLPVEVTWHSHLAAQSTSTWLDPKGKELGEGAQYFQHNVAEAKKLISAAGLPSTPIAYWMRRRVPDFPTVIANMLSDGFQLQTRVLDTNTEWRPLVQASKGARVDGVCGDAIAAGYNDESFLVNKYTPAGKFSVSPDPIPGISDAIQKARQELDTNRRNDMVKRVQKDLAMLMPDIPELSVGPRYALNWPWIKNFGVFTWGGIFHSSSSKVYTEYWYDEKAKAKA